MPNKRMGTAKKPRGRPPGSRSKPKPVVTWKDRLLLNPGESVRPASSASTGNLGQQDVEQHDVIDAQGVTVGTVVYTASTSLRPPFRTSHWVVQRGVEGNVVLEKRW